MDGAPLALRIVALEFPSVAEMREGLGEIRIAFDAVVQTAPAPRPDPCAEFERRERRE